MTVSASATFAAQLPIVHSARWVRGRNVLCSNILSDGVTAWRKRTLQHLQQRGDGHHATHRGAALDDKGEGENDEDEPERE